MRLGIDASNIRQGGGLTHLVEILRVVEPSRYGFDDVVVWAPKSTLDLLPTRSWLLKRVQAQLEANFLRRTWWQWRELGLQARTEACDVLFVPGGSFVTDFRPVVTMSRNMLPFEWRELWRYRWSLIAIRLTLLRWLQSRSFKNATGVIFLTEYARARVTSVTGPLTGHVATIPHGLDERFFLPRRAHDPIARNSSSPQIRIVYVSNIELYKHQWHVAEAVGQLRQDGVPVYLSLIGPANPVALRRLDRIIARYDPQQQFLHYLGPVPHDELPARYASADIFVFASSCENMPNILLEGMAGGMPIACSDRQPMPEVLAEAGVYFDPESPQSIYDALRQLIRSPQLRHAKATAAMERARQYSWARCAHETFRFLASAAKV